ncbi:MAG: ParB N-terminal domain-containing protein [Verrucomicrobia bacterium]|nr:ParB N-terminal domain-containing protein [Verrucomicrobiota bacterium]
MKIRLPPLAAHAAPTFLELAPEALRDADLHRFVTDHLDEETGDIVLLPGTAEEARPDFGPPPVSTEAVVRGLAGLMWRIAQHPAAPDYLEVRWQRLVEAARAVLEQRLTRREPWVATVRRVRSDLVRTVDADRQAAAAARRTEQVPIELIDQDPEQQRQTFSAAELSALAEQLRASAGVARAHVRRLEGGRFRLLIGVRTLRAAQLAGLAALCCEVHEPAPPLGRAQIPAQDAGVPRREAMVRFEVEFPAWPEPTPAEVADSMEARRWIAELEHFRHEAAQDALATAEAALLEHEAQLAERAAAEAAEAEAARQAAEHRTAALERWLAEEATEFTRERHRRGWLSERDVAWLIAQGALRKARFVPLDVELPEGTEWRGARTDDEMELILALEADLTRGGLRIFDSGYVGGGGEPLRLLAIVHLPEPLEEVTIDLLFELPTLASIRRKRSRPVRPAATAPSAADKPAPKSRKRRTTKGESNT